MTAPPAVWLIGRTWVERGPRYVARRVAVVAVLLVSTVLTGALTVGFVDGLVSGSRSTAWRLGVVVVFTALFAVGVGWTARRCVALRSAPVADLRTGRRRRTSGAGAGLGLLTGIGAVVAVVTVAAVFGGVLTLLAFSLGRYAIGEPGARREAGHPV